MHLETTNAPAGEYAIAVSLTANGRTRHLYAAGPLTVAAIAAPPVLDIVFWTPSELHIGVTGPAGQTVVLQRSEDLMSWTSLATNTLQGARWVYTNGAPTSIDPTFFRTRNLN
jgi:hypothetical protein